MAVKDGASKSNGKKGKVVLAYSGGLDTSVAIHWLKETKGLDVVTLTLDLGQENNDLKAIEAKAKKIGAVSTYTLDTKAEFANDYVKYAIWANALYGGKYPLATALGRPLIGKKLAEIAVKENADYIAHGCTGKGNDQVRFELTYQAFAPDLDVIAPWRDDRWTFRGREDLIAYLKDKHIPTAATIERPFSRDRNLWHISHEGGVLEDPWQEPPADLFLLTKDPADAPPKAAVVTIGFEEGEPVSIDGELMNPVTLIETLNTLAGEHGVGRADIVEDRLVGMKSRGVYETPAGTVLFHAHRELEQLVLDRRTLALADEYGRRYADLVYDGRWWSPEREALDAMVNATQRHVTGSVRMKLLRGTCVVQGRQSRHSLFHEGLATFSADDVYRQQDAEGFIRLYGLAVRTAAERERRLGARFAEAAD